MWSGYALTCCQFLFGFVFLVSLVSKVRSRSAYAEFVVAVTQFAPGLPRRVLAALVVLGEAAIVVLVALPSTAVFGLVLAAGLLTAFTTGILATIRRQQTVSCQCFGSSSTPVGPLHVVRNAVLLLLAIGGTIAALDPGHAWPEPGVLVAAVLTAAVAAAAVLLTDQVAELFSSNH